MIGKQTRPLAVNTGASGGIGFELAKAFAANGFDLASREELEDTAVSIGSTEEAELFAGADPAALARQSFDSLIAAPG
jgi:NAD(P)-dependent dehydrogenase (short-subunit alcohol dehydrogenase family)